MAVHGFKSGVLLCNKHYHQEARRKAIQKGVPCSQQPCSNIAEIATMCESHYRKCRKDQQTRQCIVCAKPVLNRGLCPYHYDSWYRHGDPLVSKRAISKSGSGNTDVHGYRRISVRGKVLKEHRLVMEQALGRPLLPNENVHHKDGNRLNNSLDNLELWVKSQPCGQRVKDKIKYAAGIIEHYENLSENQSICRELTPIPGAASTPIRNQRWEGRGFQVLWDTLSSLGSATTLELADLLSTSNTNILGTIHKHPDLFERSQHLPSDLRSFRWRVTQGSRPEVVLTGTINDNGYRSYRIRGKNHLEHRLVMEQHLGRKLLPKENVHHKDGDRLNNDISNLELWSTSQPPGQRVPDLVKWAHEIIQLYGQVQPTPEEPKQGSQAPTRYKRPWVI